MTLANTEPASRETGALPWRSVALLSMAAFASALSIRAVDPLLPAIGREFGVSAGAAAQVVTGFTVAYGVMQLVGGLLGDRIGKYRLASLATLLSGAVTALSVLAWSLDSLMLARLLAGAVAAAIMPMGLAWIGDSIPDDQRQVVLARYVPGQILGVIFGQTVGGVLSEVMGWRAVFATMALIQIAVGALMIRELTSSRAPGARERRGQGGLGQSLSRIGGLLRRPAVRRVLLAVFIEGFAVFGALAFAASHLQLNLQLGAGSAGLLMAGYGLGGLVYTLLSGRLMRWPGAVATAMAGAMLQAAALAWFGMAQNLVVVAALICAAGLGFYMVHNRLQFSATRMAPDSRGAALAMFASAMFLGQTAGITLGARIFDHLGAGALFLSAGLILAAMMAWFTLSDQG
ncbi:MFS transporter [Paracoccus sp. M683]|uniref:MFS transporter n=1 Tax=Paracoccus sp. M683 TaxID=2594268 RepID=UPI0011800DAE|nr:MFS transporter [Paracoccus sp. M683]TRW93037.1 MFS transporter [Paracoccus sp. M683]